MSSPIARYILAPNQCKSISTSSHFARFLKDAENFAFSYGLIMEQAPLQTYGRSACILSSSERSEDTILGRKVTIYIEH
jgi:hypothetical protein